MKEFQQSTSTFPIQILGNQFSKNFNEPATLLHALKMGENRAIQFILQKLTPPARRLAQKYGLSSQDFEEALHDTLLIFLKKIKDEKYCPTQSRPAAFAFGIYRNVLANYATYIYRYRRRFSATDVFPENLKNNTDLTFENADSQEFLELLLLQLEPKMQAPLRLKWLEGYSDKEIIAKKMSHFSTVNSLKNRRKEAMQQLNSISKGFKI